MRRYITRIIHFVLACFGMGFLKVTNTHLSRKGRKYHQVTEDNDNPQVKCLYPIEKKGKRYKRMCITVLLLPGDLLMISVQYKETSINTKSEETKKKYSIARAI